jgi:hypothetical protein
MKQQNHMRGWCNEKCLFALDLMNKTLYERDYL